MVSARPRELFFEKRIPGAHSIGGKGKGNIAPVHTMKTYRWSRGTTPLILRPNFDTRWWVFRFTFRPLYSRNNLGTHWVHGCVEPRVGMEVSDKIMIHSTCWDSNPRSSSPRSIGGSMIKYKWLLNWCFANQNKVKQYIAGSRKHLIQKDWSCLNKCQIGGSVVRNKLLFIQGAPPIGIPFVSIPCFANHKLITFLHYLYYIILYYIILYYIILYYLYYL